MSTELSKKLSSKRKKLPKNTSKYEVLVQLGLEAFYPSQLEPASILDLSTWILENLVPREPNDLPKSFLQRLWLLRPDARSTCCKALSDITASPTEKDDDFRGLRSCNVNPLELVTAVFMCANTFLQQEITTRMLQCQFATPLLLPHLDDEKPSGFLLWPLRDVVRQWQTQSLDHNQKVQEAVFASTFMPMMSCVRLGSCSVSKSEVLNHVIGTDTFIHKGMEGGQLPRTLSNGLVETAWTLPAGDPNRDSFPLPVVFANLRGDASTHEKCLYFLSQASSALIVFCENPTEKERQLLVTCKDMTPKLIVIDLTEAETKEDRAVKFIGKNLQDQLCLPDGSVVTGSRLNAGSIANVLCDALNILLPDLRLVTLEGAAKLAVELGMDCDEGKVCKRSMGSAEEVLKGLDKGHVVFRQKQLPLQGAMWSRLAEIEKMESKKNKEGKVFDPHLQKEKKDIIGNLSRYRMTPCMKNFTKAVSTTDKVERMYFLSWMRLKLRLLQMQKQINLKDLLINQQTKENNGIPEQPELQNGLNDAMGDSDSFCTDSTFEDGEIEQLAANDQEPVDTGSGVGLKPTFQIQNDKRSVSLTSGHFHSKEKENPGEEILESNGSLNPVLRESGTKEVHGKLKPHHTFAEEDTCQDSFVKDQTATSVHSCLLRFKQRIDYDLEVADSDSYLSLKQSFQTEKAEGVESLQNGHFSLTNEREIPGEEIIETNFSLNSGLRVNGTIDVQETSSAVEQTSQDASLDIQTVTSTQSFLLRLKQGFDSNQVLADSEIEEGLKHSFQTQNKKDPEALQNGHFESKNPKCPSEEFLKDVSLDPVLKGKAVLTVQENDCSDLTFHENTPEEQKCQAASVKSPTVTSAEPLTLETERFTDNDLKFVDLESDVGLDHNRQNKSNEESESVQNGHFDSSNKILEKVNLNTDFRDDRNLDVHGIDFLESNLQETSAEEQVGHADSLKDRPATSGTATSGSSFFLGLEHFLREMGLIFELSHISPGNDSHNGPQLPSVAADLILSGIPLEIMDGDSSYIPIQWVGGVLTEINHRFPQNHFRTLTSLGVHQAKNAEILSALFGVKFLDERKRSTRGLYIDVIQLPLKFKKKLNCDFLLLIDVEGLCSSPANGQISTQISDNEMATFATGMSDVLLQNLFSRSASEFETSLTVAVNALLRIREYGSIPICKVLVQDEGINTILEAAQLKRVSNILQTKTGERTLRDGDTMTLNSKKKSSILYVRPWHSDPLSRSVDTQHSEAMLKLKRRLFGALKEAAAHSETCGLPEFMRRLCSVWEAVKAESFSISLQNKEIALAFSLFCTELSQQEDRLLEYMENWLMQATKTISLTKPESLDPSSQNDFLCELKYEARREVKREVNKQRLSVKTSLKENKLDVYVKKLGTIILSNLTELEERVTTTVIERLEMINENHCSSTQLNRIETILQTHQNARLEALLDNSESDKQLTTDEDLEEEFEDIWKEALSNFDFRPSDAEDITTRVKTILSANLINRGLQKHLNKLLDFGPNQTTFFRVDDQYFGYSSRMKNLFENNNKSPKAKAQQLASNIMEYYQQFVEDKVSVPQDFSDSYITELLEMIDKTLKETHLDTRTAFEVDLKVFICNAACRDFQRVHNRFAKDGELLKSIKAKKSSLMTDFIYQFRKTDQRQRLAHRFISDIIQPTVMDYVYKPLGMQIADDIKSKAPHYLSPQAFHKSLLEGLIKDDTFESFTEYLLSYDSFRLRKIQETVVAHLSDWNVNTWRQQRLGDIIGKVAAAASQVFEGTSAALSDTKPMLEQVCLILEDGDACIPWESLKGPLFNITTDWDRFITCFMELLAALRLDLAQAFSQPIGSDQLLECLPTQPRDCLFNKVKGCDALCPVCSTPCEVEQTWHRVHQASLHRPTCMLEPTSLTSPECANPDDLGTKDVAVACWEFQPLHLDWNLSPGETSNQTPSPYWRYVLARFNDRFAKKYNQKPPLIPEEWKAMTQQDALDSLRENFFHTGEL